MAVLGLYTFYFNTHKWFHFDTLPDVFSNSSFGDLECFLFLLSSNRANNVDTMEFFCNCEHKWNFWARNIYFFEELTNYTVKNTKNKKRPREKSAPIPSPILLALLHQKVTIGRSCVTFWIVCKRKEDYLCSFLLLFTQLVSLHIPLFCFLPFSLNNLSLKSPQGTWKASSLMFKAI
jgi:hypothetical protein